MSLGPKDDAVGSHRPDCLPGCLVLHKPASAPEAFAIHLHTPGVSCRTCVQERAEQGPHDRECPYSGGNAPDGAVCHCAVFGGRRPPPAEAPAAMLAAEDEAIRRAFGARVARMGAFQAKIEHIIDSAVAEAAKPTPAAMLGEALEYIRRARDLMEAAGLEPMGGLLYDLAGVYQRVESRRDVYAKRETEAQEGAGALANISEETRRVWREALTAAEPVYTEEFRKIFPVTGFYEELAPGGYGLIGKHGVRPCLCGYDGALPNYCNKARETKVLDTVISHMEREEFAASLRRKTDSDVCQAVNTGAIPHRLGDMPEACLTCAAKRAESKAGGQG